MDEQQYLDFSVGYLTTAIGAGRFKVALAEVLWWNRMRINHEAER